MLLTCCSILKLIKGDGRKYWCKTTELKKKKRYKTDSQEAIPTIQESVSKTSFLTVIWRIQ